jgi:hypothetical protein
MNYQIHYSNLIERAKNRSINGYTERHHIIPKCIGGSNKKENIVRLTPAEHFVAHQLLVKIYPNNRNLVLAVKMMTVSGTHVIRNNKMYGWLRKKFSKAMSNRIITKETRKKMSVSKLGNTNKKGKKLSDDSKEKLSVAATGRQHTEESKRKISEAGKRPCSEETKRKIGLANKNFKSPFRGIKLKIVQCPHCNKQGAGGSMKLWHFDNCRNKDVN